MDKERPLLFRGQRLNLSMFTAQEIRNESVLKVVDYGLFDDLGHPIRNGLYDPRLGPLNRDSSCGHCHLRHNHCPGHFGHIDLPLPIYNPMTYDILAKLLKQACLVCYRFKMGRDEADAMVAQLKLARHGYGIEANIVEQFIKEKKYAEIQDILKETIKESKTEESPSSISHRVRKTFFSGQNRVCLWCGSQSRKITSGSLRIFIERIIRVKVGADSIKEELLLPFESMEILQSLTKNEETLLAELFPGMYKKQSGPNFLLPMFFIEIVPVTPVTFRPLSKLPSGMTAHSTKTVMYQDILKICIEIFNMEDKSAKSITSSYMQLQEIVSALYTVKNKVSASKVVMQGVKEMIEKKDGIFRKHIMGKRVNYIARSVISPDSAIGVDEVGIPEEFARKLTIPVGISPANIDLLRQTVINGPEYPGAEFVEDSAGGLISLQHISKEKRMHLANQLLTKTTFNAHSITDKDSLEVYTGEVAPTKVSGGLRKVWRHMLTGDNVLVNRQPSLHKVSMMGHKVKILPNERTIRLHYVNCNSYNADFDGDEMNVHFPQDIPSQVEVSEVCSTNQCFISATNGAPVRGHVQDHVVMGAILSQQNMFVKPEEYWQLLVAALGSHSKIKKYIVEQPAILRPVRLYTGNQTITAVIQNLGIDINIECKSKLGDQFIIKNSVVVTGAFDKSQIGTSSYGLTHAVNEKYGGAVSNTLLTAIGRLLNRALIVFGHSCTMEDLEIAEGAEMDRTHEIEKGLAAGTIVSDEFLRKKPGYLLKTVKSVIEGEVPEDKRELDAEMRKPTGECSSKVLEIASEGLCMKGRRNRMYMMVASGAKGSLVNLGQIISMLGQQELEGMRVPIMRTGRTLPTFSPLENTPRAHGFISQRFLTGVHAEEFYFHCMAGREGLIDTAVKTSRSGYLQRCLIKHLEGIRIDVDGSVKDADGSIIQMVYGEDGIHPERAAYLHKHDFFNANPIDAKLLSDTGLCTGDLYNLRAVQGKVSEKYLEKSYGSTDKKGLWWRYLKSTAEPGEAVGILAAQSVGEPSTQMTLNTFHLAGVGGKNVTLGMPRLKEIVMHASKQIKTPIMSISAIRPPTPQEMNLLSVSGRKPILSLISSIKLEEQVLLQDGLPLRQLKITLKPFPEVIDAVVDTLRKEFFTKFSRNMKAFMQSLSCQSISEKEKVVKPVSVPEENDDDDDSSTEEEKVKENKNETSQEEESKEIEQESKEIEENAEESEVSTEKVQEPSCISEGDSIYITLHAPISYKTLYLPRIESILSKLYLETGTLFESCSYENSQYLIQKGNIHSLFDSVGDVILSDLMDVTTVKSNSIWEMYNVFGIEAARISIIREIDAVFEVYGIRIDYRHLSLIADYMTHTGTILPFNRGAFAVLGSPMQKITYETAYSFIKNTILDAAVDNLMNPSSCLAIGKPVPIGTNSSELGYNISIES